MNDDDFVAQVGAQLTGLSSVDRRRALADLADVLDELGGPDQAVLGTPEEYARAVCDALTEPDDPARARWTPLGMPVEVRVPDDARLLARSFDPRNPALFSPRLFGGGWAVNWGAVAVRLHLLRPDDVDEEVLAAVPRGVVLAARAVPLAVSAAALGVLAARWRSVPDRVPTGWSLGGRANAWGGRGSLVATALVGVVPALWAQLPVPGNGERLVRSGRAASAAVLSTASLVAALAAVRDTGSGPTSGTAASGAQVPRFGLLVPASLPLAGATMLAVVVLPVRAGLRAVWRTRGAAGGADPSGADVPSREPREAEPRPDEPRSDQPRQSGAAR